MLSVVAVFGGIAPGGAAEVLVGICIHEFADTENENECDEEDIRIEIEDELAIDWPTRAALSMMELLHNHFCFAHQNQRFIIISTRRITL